MSSLLVRPIALLLIGAFSATSCSGVTKTPPIVRPTGLGVTRLADLRLPRGSELIVQLVGNGTVRGKLTAVTVDRLELEVWDAFAGSVPVGIDHTDVELVARVVRTPKGRRGWLGAAIGALVSIPFGISMVGDMMIPAAIVGALIGRATGDSRVEVVFEQPALSPVAVMR